MPSQGHVTIEAKFNLDSATSTDITNLQAALATAKGSLSGKAAEFCGNIQSVAAGLGESLRDAAI
jgi:hypothetical protein